ncbi:RNA-binding protein 24 isoform X3 [Sesbania bispinosa]|nr:RNA-binding protein 24 isoform X3 [Sesbania bispinosa]
MVTFREPEAAMRACVDAAPVIDGRRANCDLASLGVQRSKPSTPKHDGDLADNLIFRTLEAIGPPKCTIDVGSMLRRTQVQCSLTNWKQLGEELNFPSVCLQMMLGRLLWHGTHPFAQ